MGSMSGGKAGGASSKSKADDGSNTKKLVIAVSLFAVAGVVYFLNPFGGGHERSTGAAMTMGPSGTADQPLAPPPPPPEDGTPAEDPNAPLENPPQGSHMHNPDAPEVDPDDDLRQPEAPPEPKDR